MDTSTSLPGVGTTETWPHALPYRVIFEEQLARRGSGFADLLQAWGTLPTAATPMSPLDAEQLLEAALERVSEAYASLEQKRVKLRDASRDSYDSPDQRKQAIDGAHRAVEEAAIECQAADAPLKRLLHLCSSSALCFSGGGIRSASFSLGILQGLARFSLAGSAEKGFLHQLNYLSTVSGGGYTGSWLMGWARRSNFCDAIEQLGSAGKTAGDPEPDPVSYLRDYTSFLAPRYGFSVDTATLATIVLRNLFLNWIVFLPCLVVVILLPLRRLDYLPSSVRRVFPDVGGHDSDRPRGLDRRVSGMATCPRSRGANRRLPQRDHLLLGYLRSLMVPAGIQAGRLDG
jgi:hypothetical protein